MYIYITSIRRRKKEPPAGVEPAPRPYKGRVLAVDTTEARVDGDGRSRTDIFLGASEALAQLSYIPLLLEDEVRTGGVEPPQHEATGLQPAELADAQRPHELRGGRPGSNRRQRGSQPRMLPSTPRPPRKRGRPDSNRRPLA